MTFTLRRAAGLAAVLSIAAVLLAGRAEAAAYRVGPDEKIKHVSQVANLLNPGDVVEVTGDQQGSVRLTRHGTWEAPITVRGVTRVENGRIVRPRIYPSASETRAILTCAGDWNIVEGFEFAGSGDSPVDGVLQSAHNFTLRNCHLHSFRDTAISVDGEAGNTTIELSEIDSCGSTASHCAVNIWSRVPTAVVYIQHCYIHDVTNGTVIKSRAHSNVIRYNWFESPYYSVLKIVDPFSMSQESQAGNPDGLYPLHTDILGNVFLQGWSPGPVFAAMQIGGEGPQSPGTEGDFHIAHNLFVTTAYRSVEDPAVPIVLHGNVDRVRIYNNAFLELGAIGAKVYERGSTWDTPRTKDWLKRHDADPVLDGANNWVSDGARDVPEVFVNTLRGLNPRFVDLVNLDFRPRKDSPLAGAGFVPLPKGRMIELVPEFEPTRGIPLDQKPRARRRASVPSIGPFEAAE